MGLSLKTIYIGLLTLGMVCNIGITLLFYAQSIKVIDSTSEEMLKSILYENSMMIENNIENTELLSHQLINIIITTIPFEKIKSNPKAFDEYKKNVSPLFLNAIKNFNARSGWIVFDTNIIDQGGTLEFARIDSTYRRQPEYDIRSTHFDQDAWWADAINNDSAWSTPYYWERWDANIITYSEQVKVGDTIIGIGGSDLFIDDIYNQLSNIKIYDTGYVTLLNADYEVLYDPNEQIIGESYSTINNNQFAKVIEIIKSGKEFDVVEYEYGDKVKVIAYKKLQNGWILIANPNKYEMYADLNKLNFVLILVIIVMIVLTQLYSWSLSNNNETSRIL